MWTPLDRLKRKPGHGCSFPTNKGSRRLLKEPELQLLRISLATPKTTQHSQCNNNVPKGYIIVIYK